MRNISEYDERQIELMSKNLIYFKGSKIELNELISALEFLLSALESVDADWEEKLLKEITVLESINALNVSINSGEKVAEISDQEKKILINSSVANLKKLFDVCLNDQAGE